MLQKVIILFSVLLPDTLLLTIAWFEESTSIIWRDNLNDLEITEKPLPVKYSGVLTSSYESFHTHFGYYTVIYSENIIRDFYEQTYLNPIAEIQTYPSSNISLSVDSYALNIGDWLNIIIFAFYSDLDLGNSPAIRKIR